MDLSTTANAEPAEKVDAGTRRDLVEQNRPLVAAIAGRLIADLLPQLNPDALIASGMLGLTEAAATFDPRKHGPFRQYAKNRVRAWIIESIRAMPPSAGLSTPGLIAA